MTHRMVAATLSLLGLLLSLYLWLWKIGLLGPLACGTGSCEFVQTSSYSDFLGLPVPLIGVGGYLSLLVVSLAGLQPRWAGQAGPTRLLVALAGGGVAFSAYLTYIEAAVLNAWCRWCVASAVVITAVFVTALVGLGGKREEGRGKSTAVG
ncbi:MAG: vitamin K epoxide reductase family protein [Dehalococcoidia bacterium]